MRPSVLENRRGTVINDEEKGNIYLCVITDKLDLKPGPQFYFNQKSFSAKNAELTITSFIFLPELFDYVLKQLKTVKIFSLGLCGNTQKINLGELNSLKFSNSNFEVCDNNFEVEKTKEVYSYKFRLNTDLNKLLSIFAIKFDNLDIEENYYIQRVIKPDKMIIFNIVGYNPVTIAKLNNYLLDLKPDKNSLKRGKCLYDNVSIEDQLELFVSQSLFLEPITKNFKTKDIKNTYLMIKNILKKQILKDVYSISQNMKIRYAVKGKIVVIPKNPDKQTKIINKDTLKLISLFNGQKTNEQIFCELKKKYSFSEIDFVRNITKLVEAEILTNEKTNCSFEDVMISNIMKYPLHLVSFETTKRCNLRCVHCYNNSAPDNISPEFTIKNYASFLNKIKQLGVYELIFTGGEPLFKKNIKKLFKIASENGLWYSIFTNGTLITADLIRFFLKYPPRQIIFSLDSVIENEFKQIRGISPQKIMQAIEQLKELGFNIRINVGIFGGINDKKTSLKKLFEFLHNLDITDIVIDSFEPIGRGKINVLYQISNINSTIKKIDCAYFETFGKNYFDKNYLKKINTYCGVALDRLFVSANGKITICTLLNDDANTIGNIRQPMVELKELWENNGLLTYIREKKYLNKKCKKCNFVDYCFGGCIGKSWQKYNNYSPIDKWACDKIHYIFNK